MIDDDSKSNKIFITKQKCGTKQQEEDNENDVELFSTEIGKDFNSNGCNTINSLIK